MVGVTALAETFDISGLVTGMANGILSGISETVTALTPVITTVVIIGFAIKMFKKYVK